MRFLPALTSKANGCGLLHSLFQSADVGVLDDLRPFGDFGLDIAIERFGRGGVDGHSEIGEALLDLRLAHKPRHLRVQPRTMWRGVPAGATSANQVAASKPGSATSAIVGISGALAARCALVTASARNEPAFTLPITAERLAKIKSS